MANKDDNFGLCNICLSINSLDSYHEVMTSIVKKISELVFIDASLIRLIDKSGQKLEIAAHCGLSEEYIQKGPIFLEKSPIDKETFFECKPVVISNPAKDKRIQYPSMVGKEKVQAIISAPLRTCSHSLGIIRGYSFKSTKFSQEQINLFTRLADQAAIAIETFRSLERGKRLLEVSTKVNSSLELGNVLHTTVQLAAESLNVKGSTIRLYNENNQTMELRACWGLSDDFLHTGPSALEELPIDQEVMTGATVYIPEVIKDKRFRMAELAEKEGIVSALCVPLAAMGRHIGTLRIYTAHVYRFSEEEKNFLQTLANQAAVAVHNAQMYERLHSLFVVSSSLSHSLNKHEVFRQIVNGAAQATNAKGCALLIWKQNKEHFRARSVQGVTEDFVFHLADKESEQLKCFAEEDKVAIKRLSDCDEELKGLMNKHAIGSMLMIPMNSKDHLIGVLICFFSAQRISNPTEEELEFFRALANSATVALENAHLYDVINKKYNEMVDDVFLWYDGTSKGMDF